MIFRLLITKFASSQGLELGINSFIFNHIQVTLGFWGSVSKQRFYDVMVLMSNVLAQSSKAGSPVTEAATTTTSTVQAGRIEHQCHERCCLCFPVFALATSPYVNRKNIVAVNAVRTAYDFPILTTSQVQQAKALWLSLQETREELWLLQTQLAEAA
jgi:hypothetical protein